MGYSREYEQKLLDKIKEIGDPEVIINDILCYFSSDDTCAALESICDDYDICYAEEDE